MGGYLLDTHTAVWFFNGDRALSDTAKQIIDNLSDHVYISIASVWELAIKISIGKMSFPGRIAGFVSLAETNHIPIIPIETCHLPILEALPSIHKDPFDRLLIATAMAEQMTLITTDENIARYNVSQVW
jgi:PIN domain nuclease of toxin-antitoxin system